MNLSTPRSLTPTKATRGTLFAGVSQWCDGLMVFPALKGTFETVKWIKLACLHRVASATLMVDFFETSSQQSIYAAWKRVTLGFNGGSGGLDGKKAGISRTSSSIELGTAEDRAYGSSPRAAA